MISRIQIENFKSIRKADVKLGKLNVFFGLNASGKSNFFEVFRILQGIGLDYTVDEIFNGREASNERPEWRRIRGGSARALFNNSEETEKTIRLNFDFQENEKSFQYSSAIDLVNSVFSEEKIRIDNELTFHSTWRKLTHELTLHWPKNNFTSTQNEKPLKSSLTSFIDDSFVKNNEHFASYYMLPTALFVNQSVYDFGVETLKSASNRTTASRLGERGENLSALLNELQPSKEAILSWLNELVEDSGKKYFSDIEIETFGESNTLFRLIEGGKKVYGESCSDGTLRFIALVTAMFQPNKPERIFIEDPETGLHPSRLRTLVNLFQSSTEWENNTLLFISTHSPTFLAWLKKEFHVNTFVCFKNPDGETQIKSVTEFENFSELVKEHSFGDLVLENWFEFFA